MNTILTTFNESITPYTSVGGKERIANTGISAVVLNYPPFSRRAFFYEIEKKGFDSIISIESNVPHYNIEELSSRFPFIRFILPKNELNLGEQINLGASETQSPLFFVLRSDMKVIAGGTARRMAERLTNANEKRLCTVPVLMNSNYEVFPSIVTPLTQRRKIHPVFLEGHTEGDLTLYPFDGVGIYDKKRFIDIGGYDKSLNNKHWQLMDFGFRVYLWGEEIALNVQTKLSYDGELPVENTTIEENYRRFYLKNLAPVFLTYKNSTNKDSVDHASLPLYSFFSFLFKSGVDLFSAWKEFKTNRKWVFENRFNFKKDARSVIAKWENNNN
ncbi:MAG: hypothetical protein LBC80_07975 [Treponema sp.]|jgi:hypothetical protein|nr:hypothetical protein [Treponema sp.]